MGYSSSIPVQGVICMSSGLLNVVGGSSAVDLRRAIALTLLHSSNFDFRRAIFSSSKQIWPFVKNKISNLFQWCRLPKQHMLHYNIHISSVFWFSSVKKVLAHLK